MNVNDLYPKKWLSPVDLQGRTVGVFIEAVTVEQVRNTRTNRQENKLCLAFHGKAKRLLLNKTQAYAIASITGSMETETWPGHSIQLSTGIAPNQQATIVITAPQTPQAQAPAVPVGAQDEPEAGPRPGLGGANGKGAGRADLDGAMERAAGRDVG